MGEEVITKIDFRRPTKEWTAVCFDELKTNAKNTTSQYDKVRVSTTQILTNKMKIVQEDCEKQRRARLRFSRKYSKLRKENWKLVLFTTA